MTHLGEPPAEHAATAAAMSVIEAACLPVEQVLRRLAGAPDGLSSAEAGRRLAEFGPNAIRDHRASAFGVLLRQLRSPLLILLAVTAMLSFFLGERTDSVVIAAILTGSVGLGFGNEYRAERATAELHLRIRHTVVAVRDGRPKVVDITELVPGDVVHLQLGEVVPADLRLLSVIGLSCEESMLTGEPEPVEKLPAAVQPPVGVGGLASCALMGTVVKAGTGTGVVVATGGAAEFGRIALQLGTRQPETDFQVGLRKFSLLLMQVAALLTVLILVANLMLHRRLIDAVLFSLAIAVGITPQLLPAVVSTSLAAGSRELGNLKVLVKRLVCIEDLGDLDILLTDKTGTLTDGRITFTAALDPAGAPSELAHRYGLLTCDVDLADGAAVGGNALDVALWQAPRPVSDQLADYRRIAELPFDHERQLGSVLVGTAAGPPLLLVKGAPEAVLDRCGEQGGQLRPLLDRLFEQGMRVVAVASRPAAGPAKILPSDERGLTLVGLLTFRDEPKAGAADSLRRLAELGVEVKIATGDNPLVAAKVCADLGLASTGTLTGLQIEELSDEQLLPLAEASTIFARVSPEQKARVVRLLRRRGTAVGFLGDGVNDALALHAADVGISVDTASDVAKDAADIILLDKDLAVLADGITAGRRIFANTIKYVLMGTSSNFGNMFSAAGASAFLSFLPMLPSQILLNNLLYDTSQLAIPSDHVDVEQLHRPAHWDIGFIRTFMLFFGPISSLFDFLTFAVMLKLFHAGPELFRTGWFVESLATQTLVIFAVRTRRVPFLRSRPSWQLGWSAAAVAVLGALLPSSPLAGKLGFAALPAGFLIFLVGAIVAYLALIELAKGLFYRRVQVSRVTGRRRGRAHRIQRRASRFSAGHRRASS